MARRLRRTGRAAQSHGAGPRGAREVGQGPAAGGYGTGRGPAPGAGAGGQRLRRAAAGAGHETGGQAAEVEALRIELANLELEREQAVIRAPMDGVVTTGDVKVGDILEPGKPVVEIAEQEGFRFEAAVPSEEVGHLRVGMPARIKLDAYDYQRYGTVAGTVVFLSPDSGVPTGQGTATYLVRIELAGDELAAGSSAGG